MSALLIRLFAVVFMLIDHIAYVIGINTFDSVGLVDGWYVLRSVGRLALPLFAFLIANGFKYTRSIPKYAARMLAFAIISEIPFDLMVSREISLVKWEGMLPDVHFDNVFFTLFLGLVYLWLREIYKKKEIKFEKTLSSVTFIVLAFLATYISADYGMLGVAWVALFGIFDVSDKKNIPMLFAGAAFLAYWRLIARAILVVVYRITHVSLVTIPVVSYVFSGYSPMMSIIQTFSLASLGFVLFYNQKSGMPKNRVANTVLKYAFYAFYPVHLLVLYLIFA